MTSNIKIVNGSDIRRLRRASGLTQKLLADKAGVSQSLIARIENNSVDPRLSTIRKIINALVIFREGRTIKDIMKGPVITIDISDSVRHAVKLMRKYAISQMPVFREGYVVGSLRESTIIGRMMKSNDIHRVFSDSVYNIMDEPFETVNPSSTIDQVLKILSLNNPAVLITENGKILGIVTKIDIISSTVRLD